MDNYYCNNNKNMVVYKDEIWQLKQSNLYGDVKFIIKQLERTAQAIQYETKFVNVQELNVK